MITELLRRRGISTPKAKLFISGGHSNNGRSTVSQMSAPEQAQYSGLIADAKIYNSGYDFQLNDLNVGVNTRLLNPNAADEFGWEAKLSKDLSITGRNYYIKRGIGGSSFSTWQAPDGTDYTGWKSDINTALPLILSDANSNGYSVWLGAFLWIFGDNDGITEASANEYAGEMEVFYLDLKSYWQTVKNTYNIHGDFKFITTRQRTGAPTVPFFSTIQAAQEYLENKYEDVYLIDTDSFPVYDGLHWNPTGQFLLSDEIKLLL